MWKKNLENLKMRVNQLFMVNQAIQNVEENFRKFKNESKSVIHVKL